MLEYFGKTYTYPELLERSGGMTQFAGARNCMFTDGRAKGVEAVEVRTGAGLCFTVIKDRCLDIAWAEYKGIPFSRMFPTGVVAPSYYEPDGSGWLRGFFGGLLTTCGFTHVGGSCTVDGVPLGLHGRASYLAAEGVSVDESPEGGEYVIRISGKIRQASSLTENILLTRRIIVQAGKNRIRLEDTYENSGFTRQPFMILYHCNLGFPLINENSAVYIPHDSATSKYPEHAGELSNYGSFLPPTDGYGERVFFFKVKPGSDGMCRVLTVNDKEHPVLGLQISYTPQTLDNFAMWKLMAKGEYVVGIEPCNNNNNGQAGARNEGTLKYLEPMEKKQIALEFEILEKEELKASPLLQIKS